MIDVIDENSKSENRTRSRLPKFTPQQIEEVRGSSDFFGLNYYSSNFAEPGTDLNWAPNPSFFRDQYLHAGDSGTWQPPANGLRYLLNWIRREYDNPEVIITENGAVDTGMYDPRRMNYIRDHVSAVLDAVRLDKCNVAGYTYWSLIDNFEWMGGYS